MDEEALEDRESKLKSYLETIDNRCEVPSEVWGTLNEFQKGHFAMKLGAIRSIACKALMLLCKKR